MNQQFSIQMKKLDSEKQKQKNTRNIYTRYECGRAHIVLCVGIRRQNNINNNKQNIHTKEAKKKISSNSSDSGMNENKHWTNISNTIKYIESFV